MAWLSAGSRAKSLRLVMSTPATYASILLSIIYLFLVVPKGLAEQETIDVSGRYQLIDPPQSTGAADQVEVVELFWYGCPHCFDFEPIISRWQTNKPEYVTFRRVPAIFRESWEPHARAYYTAEILGVVDNVHQPLFDAIHVQKRSLQTKKELMHFFAEHGVNEQDFSKTYDSFAVDTLVRRSKVMQQRYGVMGVPSMVVNGKYRTSGSEAGGLENAMRVVEVLAEQEHRSMTPRTKGERG